MCVCVIFNFGTLRMVFSQKGEYVTGLRFEITSRKSMWVRMIYCLQIIWQENENEGHGVLPFHIRRTWFRLAATSSNWFLPVVVHDKWTVQHGLLCHFRFGTLTMQMCCWIVDLTYSTLWLICALNYIVKCYWSQGIILCIYWSGLLLWTSTREVV